MTSSRRRRVLASVALLAAIPALAACGAGFDANTNIPYAPTEAGVLIEETGAGPSYGKNGIMIGQAFVLGPDSGGQIAAGGSAPLYLTLLNSTQAPDTLTAVAADQQQAANVHLPAGVELAPQTLARTPGAAIQGIKQPLRGGETLRLTLQFKNAGAISLMVPVITRSREFATLPPAPAITPSSSPATSAPAQTPSASPSTARH